jgi:O26-antigen biosynthesis N-acetyl-L-fucosamine transferase
LRILILVDCYLPSTKSCAKMAHDLASALVRKGHRVIILCPDEERTVLSDDGNISVLRVKTGKLKGVGRVRRAINEARLSGNLWRRAGKFLRSNPCDMILFYSPTIFFGRLVRRLKRIWHCPSYLILRDIFPDWAVDAGVLRKGPIHEFFRRAACAQYEAADIIGVQSPANFRYFAARFPSKSRRLRVLFNWTALSEHSLPHTNYRKQLGLEGKLVLVYGGNLGVAQDVDNILRLARRLAFRSDVHFLLVGDGDDVPRVRRCIEKNALGNVQMLPAIAQDEYLSMISEFDVGLITLDARLKSHNVPGKLLSYLYWGIPVVASVNRGNDLFELLNGSQAGFCVLNGNDHQLDSAVLRLADDSVLRSEMGRNARELLEQMFSAETAADRIFEHFRDAGVRFQHSQQLSEGLKDFESREAVWAVGSRAEFRHEATTTAAVVSSPVRSLHRGRP